MSYLFIDTTNDIKIGLLNDKFKWLSFTHHSNLKASALVHGLIYEALEKENLELKDIKATIFSAGPGSYTGMRVGAGMMKIFKWYKLPVLSLYQYDIPKILYDEGIWIIDAFKKEYFIYEWGPQGHKDFLLSSNDLDTYLSGVEIKVFGSLKPPHEYKAIQDTTNLLENYSQEIFSEVVKKNLQQEYFYFRKLSEEFKRA